MSEYRKKPVVIEAVRYSGENNAEVTALTGGSIVYYDDHAIIRTLEGDMRADIGDWIIKGVIGEFYPCKPDVFEATYEPV